MNMAVRTSSADSRTSTGSCNRSRGVFKVCACMHAKPVLMGWRTNGQVWIGQSRGNKADHKAGHTAHKSMVPKEM